MKTCFPCLGETILWLRHHHSYHLMLQSDANHHATKVILQRKINSKMYLIENKEVTLLCKLNR